ncbi:MAG: nucleotidyltransferase family protein [Aquincola sp.]|nr:nucleotidyltransferase family protein [Aquincola sp.]MDH4290057.1 nucleotidyltransferase family protein [Aquincola sp.]MDH5331054.1 nucleotidyltransferase family protein [Aquincola sp.]
MPQALPALILCAGRGERLRPWTDRTPKPLLEVRGKPLVAWHLEALARAGVRRVVINTAWLEEQFPACLGDGSRWGLSIEYSFEGRDHGGALETAGGIAKALPRLASDAFWVISGDVFVPGFAFEAHDAQRLLVAGDRLAHLWLVPNAPHHATGDFGIDEVHGLATTTSPRRTWSSIGLFRAAMFGAIPPGTHMKLRPLLDAALAARRLGAERWDGVWTDVGTVERWRAADAAA